MTDHSGMQGVVLSMLSGIAFIGLVFVLYWKLLGKKYVQRKQVSAPVRVSTREVNREVNRVSP